jgi:hypothetical protein
MRWGGWHVLHLFRPGHAHSVWWVFRADFTLDRWYVASKRRPPAGPVATARSTTRWTWSSSPTVGDAGRTKTNTCSASATTLTGVPHTPRRSGPRANAWSPKSRRAAFPFDAPGSTSTRPGPADPDVPPAGWDRPREIWPRLIVDLRRPPSEARLSAAGALNRRAQFARKSEDATARRGPTPSHSRRGFPLPRHRGQRGRRLAGRLATEAGAPGSARSPLSPLAAQPARRSARSPLSPLAAQPARRSARSPLSPLAAQRRCRDLTSWPAPCSRGSPARWRALPAGSRRPRRGTAAGPCGRPASPCRTGAGGPW